jgi:DNA invertase Pin-like site-specific DNA recombinase
VVTKLDRLARSVPHMWEIVKQLQAKGVALRIVNLGIDTATPTGKLMLNVLGGVAEFSPDSRLHQTMLRTCLPLRAATKHGSRQR